MKTLPRCLIILVLLGMCITAPMLSQSGERDSTRHPYHVNYWVSGPLLAAGLTANLLGLEGIRGKATITPLELQALDRDLLSSMDRFALRQDPADIDAYLEYSNYILAGSVLLPVTLLFDRGIRGDWAEVLVIYLEAMSLCSNIYEWGFFGPHFLNRIRPVSYYEELSYEVRGESNNRNSFYSGHVSSVAASTFFLVKVYNDYHPEIGNNKYLLYGAALLPPLALGYCRIRSLRHFPSDILLGIGMGALCGILVPELHRISDENITLGIYTTPEATGLAIQFIP